jgi:hypothetical protein
MSGMARFPRYDSFNIRRIEVPVKTYQFASVLFHGKVLICIIEIEGKLLHCRGKSGEFLICQADPLNTGMDDNIREKNFEQLFLFLPGENDADLIK